jgi:hypothetical protein
MRINIAPATMIGGQVEDHLHSFGGAAGHAWLQQIFLHELDPALIHVPLDVLYQATAEIIDHPYLRTSRDQCIDQMRADERGSSGHQYFAILPILIHCTKLLFD